MVEGKKRVVKDYEALPEDIVSQVKMAYPRGFSGFLISYVNKAGKYVSALPFETAETYYLIRMTQLEARKIIKNDDDYDEDGNLRSDFGDDLLDDVAEPDLEPEIEDEPDFTDDPEPEED